MMYKEIVILMQRDQDIDISNDEQIIIYFNRPINDSSIKLPTYTELIQHPTVKIYGDMEVNMRSIVRI